MQHRRQIPETGIYAFPNKMANARALRYAAGMRNRLIDLTIIIFGAIMFLGFLSQAGLVRLHY